jgi:Outer membrane protein beta-barrel domain
MKRLSGLAAMLLLYASAARAQSTASVLVTDSENASPDVRTSATWENLLLEQAHSTDSVFGPTFVPTIRLGASGVALPFSLSPGPAEPASPTPTPRFVFGGSDDYRWQLALGVNWIRFRSSIFNASAVGIRSSVAYFTNSWFAIEGDVSASFAPQIYQKEHVKLLVYGAGPKIAWRQRQWEPWLHAIVGGAHEQPQTAASGRNAFAVLLGGGADYRFNPHLSGRLEADYARTSFFSQSQNNFQLSAGVVVHF